MTQIDCDLTFKGIRATKTQKQIDLEVFFAELADVKISNSDADRLSWLLETM